MELPDGTQLGGPNAYRIVGTLGRGGFGITYLAQEKALERLVAIKEHFPWGCSREGTRATPGHLPLDEYARSLERFAREGRVLARFNHPNIVRVHSSFLENGTAYLVLEHVQGESLTPPISPDDAEANLRTLAEALQVVHNAGLLHRDLKPDNILRTSEGRLVLIDFGAAREAVTTATAMVSPGYAAPEAYTSGPQGPELDFYALGATFYHLLSERVPLCALERLQGEQITPLAQLQPALPQSLTQTFDRCLTLDSRQRPHNANDIQFALTQRQEPETNAPLILRSHKAWIRALAFHPNGGLLASGGEDKRVHLWSLPSGTELEKPLEHDGWVTALAFSPDGELLVTASTDRKVRLFNARTFKLLSAHECDSAPLSLAIAPDGQSVAIGCQNSMLELRQLPTLELAHTSECAGAVRQVILEERFMAALCGDDKIGIWEAGTGEFLEGLRAHQGPLKALTPLPHGEAASGGSDGTIKVWDLKGGQCKTIGAHRGTVQCLTGNGERLFSGGADKTVRAWPEERILGQHQGEVSTLAFHAGVGLASAGQDGMIQIHRL